MYLSDLYPAESNHLLSVESLQQPNVDLLVARINDQIGSRPGAFINRGEYAEIKRMFVVPASRGKGIGWVVSSVIGNSCSPGWTPHSQAGNCVSQPEALSLYAAFWLSASGTIFVPTETIL